MRTVVYDGDTVVRLGDGATTACRVRFDAPFEPRRFMLYDPRPPMIARLQLSADSAEALIRDVQEWVAIELDRERLLPPFED